MNDAAFCFPSPFPRDNGSRLRRFVSDNPLQHYNPWPQLAHYEALGEARANPLIRAMYVPTLDPKRVADGFSDPQHFLKTVVGRRVYMPLLVATLHEFAHLALHFTPGKELARIYLAEAYHWLDTMVSLPDTAWTPERELCWQAARTANELLGEIFRKIVLAEELLATALSFNVARNTSLPAENRAVIAGLEAGWVMAQNKRLPGGFARFYYGPNGPGGSDGGFKRVIQLLTFDAAPIRPATGIARLAIFLESLKIGSDASPIVIDSGTLCGQLVDRFSKVEDGSQVLQWMHQELLEHHRLEDWTRVLTVSLLKQSERQAMRYLSLLPKGASPPANVEAALTLASETIDFYWSYWENFGDLMNTDYSWNAAILYPRESEQSWDIAMTLGELDAQYLAILTMEAMRQQLSARIGFRCPLLVLGNDPANVCVCQALPSSIAIREKFVKLAHWAAEGRFGEGHWSSLPSPCA